MGKDGSPGDGHGLVRELGLKEGIAIKSILIGSLPDAIADRAPCSVLMVRRHESAGISLTRRIVSSLRGGR